jgi:serine/threonine protein kinase
VAAFSAMPTLGPGSRLGQYEIVAPLRAGGMATLFLGRRVGPAGFARHVAIKVVHSHLASDPSFIEMFLDEARLAACIQHPNVVHTEELGEENGMYYLAMEYVHGCSLAQFLMRLIQQKRGLAPEVAVHIAMKLADGLHAAHEVKDENGRALGVVHRDISPQNVLLAYNGQVKLIDFGVAKAAGRSRETTGASLKGKIRYMSPEQAWGRTVDRRTDVYALGIVLWEALTHRRLFVAEDDFAALERVRTPVVPPPSTHAPFLGEALDHAVMTALAPDPAARFQTAQAFRRALGGACPKAVGVEAEDLGALLISVMEDDIERERKSAPPAVTRALEIKPPEPARRTGAMNAYTREMPAYTPSGEEQLTAAEVPSARAAGAPAVPVEPVAEQSRVRTSSATPAPVEIPGARSGGPIVIAIVGLALLALGGLGVWLMSSSGPEPTVVAPTAAPIVLAPAPVAPTPVAPVTTAPEVVAPVATPPASPTRARVRTERAATPPPTAEREPAPPPTAAPIAPTPSAEPAHLPSTIAPTPQAAPPVAPVAPAPIAPAPIRPSPIRPSPIAPAPITPAPRHTPDGPYLQEPTF